MSCRIWSFLFAWVAVLATGISAAFAAQITYVDATEGVGGNTALAAGGTFTSVAAASGTDGLWRGRAFGNGATIFESAGDNSNPTGTAVDGNNENAPRLVTTISGLANLANYHVYAYFWDTIADTPQNWPIRAGLTNPGGDLPLFNGPGAPVAVAADFVTARVITEADRHMRQAYLGIGQSNGLGQLQVYVDDDPAARQGIANGYEFRSWYDGVGYELVPEPTAITMFLLAQPFALLRVRKRAR